MQKQLIALTMGATLFGSVISNAVMAQDCAALTEELTAKIAEMADADPAKLTMAQELADKAMAAKDGGDEASCSAAVEEAMAMLTAE